MSSVQRSSSSQNELLKEATATRRISTLPSSFVSNGPSLFGSHIDELRAIHTLVSPFALLLLPKSWYLVLCSPVCVSSDGHAYNPEIGQVHRPLLSTEEQVPDQFGNGGAASLYRGQWLCYEAAFKSMEGIVLLEGALGMAVDRDQVAKWIAVQTK